MTYDRLKEIMEEDIETQFPDSDNALMGLNIIAKYLPQRGIEGAEYDIIYSVDVEELANAGITEEDAKTLRRINWMIDEDSDCLACFV